MLNLVEKNDVAPLCPHCETRLSDLWFKELSSLWGKRYIYFCSRCQKTLGISHRKGFWMG